MALLTLHPWSVSKKTRKKILHKTLGPHLYFRHIKDAVIAQCVAQIDLVKCPRVFLYGNPHIDNYMRSEGGCAMTDFDSAMYGPYLFDVMSVLVSVQLRREQMGSVGDVMPQFIKTYCEHLHAPHAAYRSYTPLLVGEGKPSSVMAYIAAQKKWALNFVQNPVPATDIKVRELLRQYFLNLNDDSARYQIDRIGVGFGSMGRQHYLIAITEMSTDQKQIIDIKNTRNYLNPIWPHHQFYIDPFSHQGERMIAASKLHAPGVTQQESLATLNGEHYWGQRLPMLNKKIKGLLSNEQVQQFIDAVASQFGRSHALSLETSATADSVEKHLREVQKKMTQHIDEVVKNIRVAWQYFGEIANEKK